VDEIVSLSVRYGIITPYTSFLVEETEKALTDAGREIIVEKEVQVMATPAPAFGAGAVEKSVIQESLRGADTVSAPTTAEVKHVSDKAFVLHDGVWTDTLYEPDRMETARVGFGSEGYFDLLAARPEWGKYFALGQHVIVVLEGRAYEVAEGDYEPVLSPGEGMPELSSDEIKLVLGADPVEGPAPLTVSFTAELVGGPDNNELYYCGRQEFGFGDGMKMDTMPSCLPYSPDVVIQRLFTTSYTYKEAGTYTASFSLPGLRSNDVAVVVRSPESTPIVRSPEPTPTAAPTSAESPGKPLCPGAAFGAVLPLLGLALAWRRR
jgi:hypothetical protein